MNKQLLIVTLLMLLTLPLKRAAAQQQTRAVTSVDGMQPAGGSSRFMNQGAAGDVTISVEATKIGVPTTLGPGNGDPTIECGLHWGVYGEAWSDLAMQYVGDSLDLLSDVHEVTLTAAMLNAMPVGTIGFTAYCSDDGDNTRTWRQTDDGGDGIITILPAVGDDIMPAPNGAFVHLFSWRWDDIALECENWLGPKGFTAVQVSPPSEHVVVSDFPWWQRYQPVSYDIETRSGTRAQFADMVSRCNAAGVEIYVDAVINHMTGSGADSTETGYNGTQYRGYTYPYPEASLYGPNDFHNSGDKCSSANGEIATYGDRRQVQYCELLGLADLNTEDATVQAKIAAYLNDLTVNLGVGGFRVDGAKHMFTYDLEQIFDLVAGDPYIFQEVIHSESEPIQKEEYVVNGDVTEFYFGNDVGSAFNGSCGGKLADLQNFALNNSYFLESNAAVVFTDNHDSQRGGGCVMTYKIGVTYDLANVFMLAWPYGYPKVMSSYHFSNRDQGPPSPGDGETLPVYDGSEAAGAAPARCDASNWVCEHRRQAIANMVGWRHAAAGQPVTDWWDNGNDQIAFGRSGSAFVVINRENAALSTTLDSGMAAGVYCDVIHGDFAGGVCSGPTVTVAEDGSVTANVAALDALAIHKNARVDLPTAVGVQQVTQPPSPLPLLAGAAALLTGLMLLLRRRSA